MESWTCVEHWTSTRPADGDLIKHVDEPCVTHRPRRLPQHFVTPAVILLPALSVDSKPSHRKRNIFDHSHGKRNIFDPRLCDSSTRIAGAEVHDPHDISPLALCSCLGSLGPILQLPRHCCPQPSSAFAPQFPNLPRQNNPPVLNLPQQDHSVHPPPLKRSANAVVTLGRPFAHHHPLIPSDNNQQRPQRHASETGCGRGSVQSIECKPAVRREIYPVSMTACERS